MKHKAPILITGIPRSGATMIAATINLCGAFGGNMTKRGMYTNDRIRDEVVKPYFICVGADPDAQKDFPKDYITSVRFDNHIERIISEQGYREGPWMYKDYRISHQWPLWDMAYPNAKWIIVRRRTGDIIESCMKTAYMKAYDNREGWLQMVHAYEHRFVEMIEAGLNCKIIWPERMVNGDYTQLFELTDWLGLTWKNDALQFIDSLLWKKHKLKGRIYYENNSSGS